MKLDKGRIIGHVAAAALLAAVGYLVVPTMYMTLVSEGQANSLLDVYLVNAVTLVFVFALPGLLLAHAFETVWQQFRRHCRRLSVETTGYCMLGAVGATLVASLLVMLWQPYAEQLAGKLPATPPLPQPQNAKEWILSLLSIAVAPAVCEEIFFRGFLQSVLSKWLPRAALWLTAVVFAVLHFELLSFPGLLLIGWTLGTVLEKRGLIASMLFHAAYNGAVLLLSAQAGEIGLLGIFLCMAAYVFSIRALKREEKDHAFDGTGV